MPVDCICICEKGLPGFIPPPYPVRFGILWMEPPVVRELTPNCEVWPAMADAKGDESKVEGVWPKYAGPVLFESGKGFVEGNVVGVWVG